MLFQNVCTHVSNLIDCLPLPTTVVPTLTNNHIHFPIPTDACQGTGVPEKYTLDNQGKDIGGIDRNESCDESKGYQNNCTDSNGHTIRCRLCATCVGVGAIRYKRTGSGTVCKLCPDPITNKIFIAVGFVVMVIGSAVMVYMAITSETSQEETSDAVKKIIVNFLQMISLAGGLPLQWPSSLALMFESFATLSSAGTTMMIPDCELTAMKTADAFYLKQVAYTFSVPLIIVCCIWAWCVIWCCCRKKLKLTFSKWKDYTILTLVLMLFLCYPMLVKLTLSMLKCPLIGVDADGNRLAYLMADLQEPCFRGRHIEYVVLLTVPQLIAYVFGMPCFAAALILRNRKQLYEPQFFRRYGLLYMGYREGREWWELVIAFRKVMIVVIGTFGTLIGVVDLQIFLALGTIFAAIIIHLIGQPFDVSKKNTRALHQFEFFALTLCWCTFWGGMLFFLGHEQPNSVADEVLMLTTVVLVGANCLFLLYSAFVFLQTYLVDRKVVYAQKRKSMLAVAPVAAEKGTEAELGYKKQVVVAPGEGDLKSWR